jgi:heparan-alpha-glucosaminide N-acetyltransferase
MNGDPRPPSAPGVAGPETRSTGGQPMLAPEPAARLTSMDAYRGFVMFLMMAEVLHLARVAQAVPESGVWKFLAWHQTHVPWVGCTLHDLIQPSFSFLVGVALPFSIASRSARGQSQASMTWHALWRALVLVLLGVFLRSTGATATNWTFEDTLTQIGLGYGFLFALGFRPVRDQWIALGVILVGYWAWFAAYPLPGPEFDYAKVGVTQAWLETHGLSGFGAHWQKNSNAAAAFDTWFMNLFERERPFVANRGGYLTLNFIPTLGTMILGLIAGQVMRSARSPTARLRWLVTAGVIGLASGWLLGWLGICPVVKRIWTPSWVLFSGGWCFLLLAAFYAVVDVRQHRRWAFPLVVIGVNSIAAYLIAHLFDAFILKNLVTHLGKAPFLALGPAYQPFLHGAAALAVMWLLLFWMCRRKLYLTI